MSEQSIFNAMPVVATALCEKYGVKVIVCGHEAYTNGTEIVLPTALNVPVTTEELNGFLVHECSHVKFTDFSCGFRQKLPQILLNILEDGRIERKMCEAYPGARYYLHKVEEKMLSGKVSDAAGVEDLKPTDRAEHILLETCYLWARVKMAGFSVEYGPRMPAAEAACRAVFGDKLTGRLFVILGEAEKAESTADLRKSVEKICALLKRTAKKGRFPQQQQTAQPKPFQPQSQQQLSPGREQQGGSSGSSDDSKTGGQSGDRRIDAGASSKSSDAANRDDGSKASKSSRKAKPNGSGLSDADAVRNAGMVLDADDRTLEKEADRYSPQEEVKRKLNAASYCDGVEDCCWTSAPDENQGPLEDSLNLSNVFKPEDWTKVNLIIPRLRRRIRSAVEARDRTKRFRAEAGRTLTLDGLVRHIGGDPRVFERRQEGKAVNTAVHLLIDVSGSMQGERIAGAQIAAISLMKVLAGLKGINLGVSVFPGYPQRATVGMLSHGEGSRAGRIEEAAQNVSKIHPWGGTPMREALLEVAKELRRCTRCTRRILYILTDGNVREEVAPLLYRIRTAGIETRALLIAGRRCGFDVEVRLRECATAEEIASSLIEMVTADVVA